MRNILAVIFALGIGVSIASPAYALNVPQPPYSKVCGATTYSIQRLVDGFFIRVTDPKRVRTTFYTDIYQYGHGYSSTSDILSECQDSTLALKETAYGKYSRSMTLKFLDPAKEELAFADVSHIDINTAIKDSVATSTAPQYDALYSAETDPWTVVRPQLVKKMRIAPIADALNDQSFYVFGSKSGIVRKSTASQWHTTTALSTVTCSGAAYTLYDKSFAAYNTATSTSPAHQFMVERVEGGSRTLIPVPYVDGSWREHVGSYYPELYPALTRCFGKNVGMMVAGRLTVVSAQTKFVQYVNDASSLARVDYDDGIGIYAEGSIYKAEEGIVGEAAIRTLNPDGTVTIRKPVFFKDLNSYPLYSSMTFLKDSQNRNDIVVKLSVYSKTGDTVAITNSYFVERNGVYTEVQRDPLSWKYAYAFMGEPTPLYVSAEKGMLTLRSFFLENPMLLHNLPNTAYTLLWNRVGPLEQDGTRKVWYALRVNGITQTWLAIVH